MIKCYYGKIKKVNENWKKEKKNDFYLNIHKKQTNKKNQEFQK